MGWIECVRCEKFQRDFVAQTFALIELVHAVSHWISCYETIPNAPKHYETHKNMRLGSNVLDRVRSLQKIPSQLHGTNFWNNCTNSASLHHVLCGNKTIQNAPKHYETHQNMSLGSNGADRVRSLRKITMWLRGTNFCINCTSPHRFAPSFM